MSDGGPLLKPRLFHGPYSSECMHRGSLEGIPEVSSRSKQKGRPYIG